MKKNLYVLSFLMVIFVFAVPNLLAKSEEAQIDQPSMYNTIKTADYEENQNTVEDELKNYINQNMMEEQTSNLDEDEKDDEQPCCD